MKLHLVTIVLDGILFLPAQFMRFNALHGIDWHWSIAHGSARNVKDTSWCKAMPDRLSTDGTTEFLRAISGHPKITVHERAGWDGKTEMVNACLAGHDEDCVLLQVDVDEVWDNDQLMVIADEMFRPDSEGRSADYAMFGCRYFVGPNIVITSENNYGNRETEWVRAWNFRKGQRFVTHEPPVLSGVDKSNFHDKVITRSWGLVFDHYAYAFRDQVQMKESYYGYKGAVDHWLRLQENREWPVKELRNFLPWVDKGVTADRLWR